MSLGEFGRIERYFRPLAAGVPGALGLTDDAAVLPVPVGRDLVVTTDALVAGVHFLPDDPPEDIAAKLMRVNLSDLAAMGAAPFGYTLITSLPSTISDHWVERFARGLAEDQARFGIALFGGDSVSTAGPITVALTALGLVAPGCAVTRRSARTEVPVFVTGTIGDATLGLMAALNRPDGDLPDDPAARAHWLARLRRPDPRLTFGREMAPLVLAAADVSDGLVADLGHIAACSGCAADIAADRVPLFPATAAWAGRRLDRLSRLLTGGDDYELLIAAAPEHRAALAALGARLGVAVTEIGQLVPGPAGQVTVRDPAGAPMALASTGWVHG